MTAHRSVCEDRVLLWYDDMQYVELSVDHNVANKHEMSMLADKGVMPGLKNCSSATLLMSIPVADKHGRVWATSEDGERLIGFNLTRALGDRVGKRLVLTATPEQQVPLMDRRLLPTSYASSCGLSMP